jgi:hypothetical protein
MIQFLGVSGWGWSGRRVSNSGIHLVSINFLFTRNKDCLLKLSIADISTPTSGEGRWELSNPEGYRPRRLPLH